MAQTLIVKSRIKDLVGELNVSGDLYPTLTSKVEDILKRACERAKANGRRTVMGKDI